MPLKNIGEWIYKVKRGVLLVPLKYKGQQVKTSATEKIRCSKKKRNVLWLLLIGIGEWVQKVMKEKRCVL